MAIAERLLKAFVQGTIFLAITLASVLFLAMASEKKLYANNENEAESLQTVITQRDLQIIEHLVTIAQRNSVSVREAKAAMGLSAFEDVVTVELSPSQTTITTKGSSDVSSDNERSFSLSITIDPIKVLTAIQKLPLVQARWNEAKGQKRVAVMQHYVTYLQARQASKIAAYRMQKFIEGDHVASVHSRASTTHVSNHIANPNYVAVATEMLNTSTRERLALEELAACVGLSYQAMIAVINEQ